MRIRSAQAEYEYDLYMYEFGGHAVTPRPQAKPAATTLPVAVGDRETVLDMPAVVVAACASWAAERASALARAAAFFTAGSRRTGRAAKRESVLA